MQSTKLEEFIKQTLVSKEENKIDNILNALNTYNTKCVDTDNIREYIRLFQKDVICEFKCLKRIEEILYLF